MSLPAQIEAAPCVLCTLRVKDSDIVLYWFERTMQECGIDPAAPGPDLPSFDWGPPLYSQPIEEVVDAMVASVALREDADFGQVLYRERRVADAMYELTRSNHDPNADVAGSAKDVTGVSADPGGGGAHFPGVDADGDTVGQPGKDPVRRPRVPSKVSRGRRSGAGKDG